MDVRLSLSRVLAKNKIKEGDFEMKANLWFSDHIKEVLPGLSPLSCFG